MPSARTVGIENFNLCSVIQFTNGIPGLLHENLYALALSLVETTIF
jgi:hypothetical protein